MIRSADQGYYDDVMRGRFVQLCEAAAAAADVKVEVEFSGGASTMKHNRRSPTAGSQRAAYGIPTRAWTRRRAPPTWPTCRGSCPPSTRTCRSATEGTPGHTTAFRDAAASPKADEMTLLAATLVAQTALDLLADPALVAEAWREFRG